jgi:hypothetical protein
MTCKKIETILVKNVEIKIVPKTVCIIDREDCDGEDKDCPYKEEKIRKNMNTIKQYRPAFYVTMVKVKFRNEEAFKNFVDLIKNKLFCSKEIDFCICDNDDGNSPKSENIESLNSANIKSEMGNQTLK